MAIERIPIADNEKRINKIEAVADSSSWECRLTSVGLTQELLLNLPSEKTVERVLGVFAKLSCDFKWEVRKAIIPVLILIRRPAANELIEQLAKDGNQWVRNSAKQAKRKLARVTSAGDKRDSRANVTFEAIKDIDSQSGKKVYDAAILVGEKAYEELAGDTAHELNTYRASLEGLLEELERRIEDSTGLSPGVREILIKIDERSKYLNLLTQGLIEYARNTELQFEEKALLTEVESAFELARQKNEKSLATEDVVDDISVPAELIFEASWDRLFLALTNLISNAIEAVISQNGEKTVSFRVESIGRDSVVLTISDTGCGMEASQTESAKKPFRSLKKHQGGIGLGLPLAVKIIEREHNGRFEIESELNAGTTITIELPLKHEEN